MSDRSSNETSPERSPWSRASVLLSGAFLLALVLLGMLVATTSGGGGGHPEKTPATAARPAPTPAKTTASGCRLSARNQTVPLTSPPQAQWGTVGSMQVPQNPAVYGPERSDGPWETCFVRSPSGALLAAMNLWAEGTAVPPSELFARLAIGAPRNLGSSEQLDSNGPIQFAGYRYQSYTPSDAQIAIVFEGPEGKLLVVTTMVWDDGDWKYLFPTGGAPAMQVIPDLTGYVQWSSF